jgi:hypothetical protein
MSSSASQEQPQSYAQRKLAELRLTQGLKPIKNAEDLCAHDIWPEEDDIDEFLVWLERARRGEE